MTTKLAWHRTAPGEYVADHWYYRQVRIKETSVQPGVWHLYFQRPSDPYRQSGALLTRLNNDGERLTLSGAQRRAQETLDEDGRVEQAEAVTR